MNKRQQRKNWRKVINNKTKLFGLIVCIIILLFILGLLSVALWPRADYYIRSTTSVKNATSLFEQPATNNIIPDTNRLLISKIGVNTDIVEGKTLTVLDKHEGVWHEPNTSDPTHSGNMVIAGHRFKWLPPNKTTFYNLDKIAAGDEIIVFWDKQKYTYEVYETTVVKPTQVDIRNDHGFKELTLYTCTPLWTTKERLVIKAKLVDK